MGNGPVAVSGVRSENSGRLLYATAGTVAAVVSLRDIYWTSQSGFISGDGDWINYNLGGVLALHNVNCKGSSPVVPVILLGTTGKLTVTAAGLATSQPPWQLFSAAPTQNVTAVLTGYTQLTNAGSTGTAVFAGPVRLAPSSTHLSFGAPPGTSRDTMTPIETLALASAGAVTITGYAETAEITLSASATSSSVTNLYPGQRLTISWIQDSSGSRSYVWPAVCKFAGGVTPPASTAPGAADTLSFVYDGTSLVQCDPAQVQLAGDLGGTLASPQVAKIQGTAISLPPGSASQFLAGDGTWGVPAGTAGGTLPAVSAPSGTATLANAAAAAFASTAGGAYTITLGSAVTAAAGVSQFVTKTSPDANVLSVAPPAGQTIGGTSQPYVLTGLNDSLQVISDGANWQPVAHKTADQVITSSRSWTVPGGWSLIEASVIGGGAGGGGGGSPSSNIAQVGGTGGTSAVEVRELFSVTPGLVLTLTAGAAGTGGAGGPAGGNAGASGGTGGTSSLTGTGVATLQSTGGWPGGTAAASSTTATQNSPWGNSRSIGASGSAGSNAAGSVGGIATATGGINGGSPVGLAGGGGGAGGPAATGTSLGGTAGAPGSPGGGGTGGNAGASAGVNGITAADAAPTSYGAGGGGGGGGATAGAGGSGGKGGPGVIILRRRG
jgi:hypothetical protein